MSVKADAESGPDSVNPRSSNTVDQHVGGRMKYRRIMLGLSQEKLGESLGITFQQVQKYEKGANRVSAGRLFELSRILGVSVQFFFEGLAGEQKVENGHAQPGFSEAQPEDELEAFLSSREGMQLNRSYLRIGDQKQRRAVLDLIKSMADEKYG